MHQSHDKGGFPFNQIFLFTFLYIVVCGTALFTVLKKEVDNLGSFMAKFSKISYQTIIFALGIWFIL